MKKLIKKYIGYRTEDLRGSGCRDTIEVTDFEIDELQNEDIMDTLNLTKTKTKQFIKRIYKQGYTRCIWICKTRKELKECYGLTDEKIDCYKIKNGIVLSDLEEAGLLIAYKPDNIF